MDVVIADSKSENNNDDKSKGSSSKIYVQQNSMRARNTQFQYRKANRIRRVTLQPQIVHDSNVHQFLRNVQNHLQIMKNCQIMRNLVAHKK
jgi:hypothetical protein